MNKILFTVLGIVFYVSIGLGQVISVANERQNIFTVGLDNSLCVAVENIAAKSIIVKTDNGELKGANGFYYLNPSKAGIATISIYKSANGRLKKIGEKYFRAKLLWDPVFKIGSGKQIVSRKELAAQQFVRAELENSDFEMKFTVDSFKICIVHSDTCNYIIKYNIGNRISEEIKEELQLLHANDTIIFKDIYCTGPGGQRKIAPVIIFVSE